MINSRLPMRNIKYGVAIGLALICLLLFAGCSDSSGNLPEKGYGQVTIKLTGDAKSARTAFPGTYSGNGDTLEYAYKFFESNGTTLLNPQPQPDNSTEKYTLSNGSYLVNVDLLDGLGGSVLASGKKAFTVNGDDTVVKVAITDFAAGDGTLTYNISNGVASAVISKVAIGAASAGSDVVLYQLNYSNIASAIGTISGTETLAAGSYLVEIEFVADDATDDTAAKYLYESVAILSGLTTDLTKVYDSLDTIDNGGGPIQDIVVEVLSVTAINNTTDGTASGFGSTTALEFTLDTVINYFAASDINIGIGAASAHKGTLSGPVGTASGQVYTLPITEVLSAGETTVSISTIPGYDIRFASNADKVTLSSPTKLTYTVAGDLYFGLGVNPTGTTSALNFTFSSSITGISAADILLSKVGDIETGAEADGEPSGSGTAWSLNVKSVATSGIIGVHVGNFQSVFKSSDGDFYQVTNPDRDADIFMTGVPMPSSKVTPGASNVFTEAFLFETTPTLTATQHVEFTLDLLTNEAKTVLQGLDDVSFTWLVNGVAHDFVDANGDPEDAPDTFVHIWPSRGGIPITLVVEVDGVIVGTKRVTLTVGL